MNLHGQIMNLPAKHTHGFHGDGDLAYRTGHRDARHAAAELALKADADVAALLAALALVTLVLKYHVEQRVKQQQQRSAASSGSP